MHKLSMCVLMSLSCLAWAQQPVSGSGDTGLSALMDKVEGKQGANETRLVNDFRAEGEAGYQVAASDMAERYYRAILADDLVTAYEMMSKDFRKAVSLQNYLKKDRVRLQEVHIQKIEFGTEECARVTGITKGTAGSRLGEVNLPVRLRIFLEDGKWVVYTNPYKQMGFTLPQAKNVKYPCSL